MVDVFVRSKVVNGKTLREIADLPETRGIYLRKITRNMVEIPVLPETELDRLRFQEAEIRRKSRLERREAIRRLREQGLDH
jgi:dissimilatory sulfite reductase (desulfoviridin) alpha/beta subunit